MTTSRTHLPGPGYKSTAQIEVCACAHLHTHTHTHTHTHIQVVTGPRPLHRFPTCSCSLSRLCDLWYRPPRDFNLHRDKCNKRNNLEIRAKEDTFTNPFPKVGWGCHHVICAGDEAGRGREGGRELEKADWGRGCLTTSSSPSLLDPSGVG